MADNKIPDYNAFKGCSETGTDQGNFGDPRAAPKTKKSLPLQLTD